MYSGKDEENEKCTGTGRERREQIFATSCVENSYNVLYCN
jgi:hypothetical protein